MANDDQETRADQATGEQSAERPLTASVEKLRHELDHWLEVAWSQGERALDAFGLKAGLGWSPKVDIVETADDVRVFVDLPGVDPQSVDLTLAGNMLTLKGEKPALSTEPGETVHLQQRSKGSFTRSIPMPTPVNAENVSAEAKDGVMRIRMTKAESAKTRSIPVGDESRDG